MRWPVYVAAAVVSVGSGIMVARYWPASAPGSTDESTVTPLRQLPLSDLSGATRTLGEWRGQVLLVNFWATWCAPCREEIPLIQRARERYHDRNFEVIGVAIDDAPAVAAYRDELAIRYPLLVAATDAVGLLSRFGNDFGALPHTVILDADGAILATHLGPVTETQLEALIQSSL